MRFMLRFVTLFSYFIHHSYKIWVIEERINWINYWSSNYFHFNQSARKGLLLIDSSNSASNYNFLSNVGMSQPFQFTDRDFGNWLDLVFINSSVVNLWPWVKTRYRYLQSISVDLWGSWSYYKIFRLRSTLLNWDVITIISTRPAYK